MSGRELLLLDTNVVVHVLRGKDLGLSIEKAYGLRSSSERPLISIVTVGEVFALGRQWNWGETKMAALRELLAEFVVVDISHKDVLERYAEIRALDKRGGWNLSHNDTWIGATASVTDALLLTTDKDFGRVDVSLLRSVYIDPSRPGQA